MEKLIELLNEFINKTIIPYDRGAKCIGYENWKFIFEDGGDVLEDTVISARYGFIKWLVENDKIVDNGAKLEYHIVKWGKTSEGEYVDNDTRFYTDYETLLMLLSISDTPIEDLVSYLR